MATDNTTAGGVEAQLASLYKEREMLEKELGMSDAGRPAQARQDPGGAASPSCRTSWRPSRASIDPSGAAAELRLLREQFSDCGKPEIVFESIDGKRTLRVVWKAAA